MMWFVLYCWSKEDKRQTRLWPTWPPGLISYTRSLLNDDRNSSGDGFHPLFGPRSYTELDSTELFS